MDEAAAHRLLADAGREARPYQSRIVNKTIGLFAGTVPDRMGHPQGPSGSVLVESPTGSGKTVMGLAIAKWMQKTHGMSVGWVAMRRNLLSQAQAENSRGFGIEMRPISMFDKHPPQADLLIIDEAQHDGSFSMANLFSYIKPKKVLGLTATPFRTDRFKLCFEKIIRDAGIHSLIQDGYLSPFHHYTIDEYEPKGVAELYARDRKRWGQSLIFFHREEECQVCHARLKELGVEAEVVTAKTDRERQIEDFASGRIQVLVNMLILAEGFDCPSLKTVFCRPSSKLPTIQMAGRALRTHPDLPYKQIVQCDATRYPFPRTATPAEQYLALGDEWRSLKSNSRIDAICLRMAELIAGSRVELPKFMTKPARKSRLRARGRGSAAQNSKVWARKEIPEENTFTE
jgi:superfamily II DNA or RNA helicase